MPTIQGEGDPIIMSASVDGPQYNNTFGGYSRHFWSSSIPKDRWNKLVWVNRWYNPLDDRSRTPVQRHKFLSQPTPHLPLHWTISGIDKPLGFFSRSKEQDVLHIPVPKTRCERWSTLREMFPSKGHNITLSPPKWGTNESYPPMLSARRPNRFPHINSPMTNYVDDMHKSNSMFRLY